MADPGKNKKKKRALLKLASLSLEENKKNERLIAPTIRNHYIDPGGGIEKNAKNNISVSMVHIFE